MIPRSRKRLPRSLQDIQGTFFSAQPGPPSLKKTLTLYSIRISSHQAVRNIEIRPTSYSDFDASLAPCWCSTLKSQPRCLQDAPKTRQLGAQEPPRSCPRGIQEAAEAAHRCVRARRHPRAAPDRPKAPQTLSRLRCWSIFGQP